MIQAATKNINPDFSRNLREKVGIRGKWKQYQQWENSITR
jgi:hypothetical protein